ncbi:MAG TPA: Lrp/AsnC family transcriptional regulator [Thermomicrobiales bacterium]|nr:Lrp/AsnC family transcriptional regulator [Thermomicrobiales bacterium]
MSTIDTLDERILSELQANGRLTMKALAERVGLSSPAMIERVRRLEERGVLAGYRAIVDPAAIGRPLSALIAADIDRRNSDRFLDRLRIEPSVVECLRTTGDRSFLIKVNVASTDELEQLVDELAELGARCSTSIVLSAPIQDAPIVPPEGAVSQRTRLSRRRRRSAMRMDATPARPGAAPIRPDAVDDESEDEGDDL